MRTLLSFTSVSTAALLAAALSAAPVSAEGVDLSNPDDPMTIIVSLPNQRAKIYRGTSVITSTAVSTGKPGHATKAGVYSILEKRRRHFSNLYNGAPMPWMQRLTWTGTALHAGKIPGYPASHGCIRLPYSFAPKLFKMTEVGGQVVVAHSMVEPRRIAHPALFQPVPPPMPPELLSKVEPAATPKRNSSAPAFDVPKAAAPMRKSMNTPRDGARPGRPFRLPVILAKAGGGLLKQVAGERPVDAAPTRLSLVTAMPAAASATRPVEPRRRLHSLEDTTQHAIDPGAAPFIGSGAHAITSKTPSGAVEVTGSIGGSIDEADKHQARLVDPEAPKSQDRLAGESTPKSKDRLEAAASESVTADTAVETAALEPAVTAPDKLKPALKSDEAAAPEVPLNATDGQGIEAAASADPIAAIMRATAQDAEAASQPATTVSAQPLAPKTRQPLSVTLSVLGVNDHPPLPLERPSVMVSRLKAGAKSAAVEAAEPISQEPLRILVTRRTTRDRTVDLQYILSDMGYLAPQNFDGTRGSATIRALKKFQKDNDMPVTGAFTDDVFKKVYEVAGKAEPSEGQLFVRQKFASVFSVPVSFSDPDKPLGTHLFTIMHFEPGATKADWTAISLNDKESAESVLNRIKIPANVRQRISERLTPGSSLIVADTAINSAALPKGADFLVWDTSKKAKVQRASVSPRRRTRSRSASTQRRARPSASYSRQRAYRSRYSRRSPQRRGPFGF